MKKIAVINDLSGFGKCSLSAALPIISAHGIQCCPLTTGIFSNQTGYDSFESVDFTNHMQNFINQWKRLSPSFEGILTGFISNSKQGKIIADFIDEFKTENTVVVVDPVMGDNGEIYPCYDTDSINAVKKLVEKADIITPNLTELCLLADEKYVSVSTLGTDTMIEKIKSMSANLNKIVVTTGIQLTNDVISNAVFSNGNITLVKAKKLGGSFSGTGDILASIITAQYINGIVIEDAVKNASAFIEKAIKLTIKDTNGNYNPCDGVHFEAILNTLI